METRGQDRKFTEPRRPDAVLRGKLPVPFPKFPIKCVPQFRRARILYF